MKDDLDWSFQIDPSRPIYDSWWWSQFNEHRIPLPRVIFLDEKIVIVEMHGIHAVLALEKREMVRRSRRRLHAFAPAEHRDHAAEITSEGAADRSLVDARPASEDRRLQIFGDVDLVVSRRGKLAGTAPDPFGR